MKFGTNGGTTMKIKNLSIASLLLAGVAFAGCAGTGSGAGGGGGASTDTTVAPAGGT
jgi:hypothetical protein